MTESQQLALIKTQMPLTYAAIRKEAAGPRGRDAYALVRRSLRGEAGCFYAVEAGHVMGTPFAQDVTADAAQLMVRFGVSHLVIWPPMEATHAN